MTPDRVMIDSSDGVCVALHHLGGSGPPVIFCHATGFHARVWDPVASALASELDCWAIDLRGHGDTPLPDGVPLIWTGMAADVLAAADHIGDGPLFAVGHSMGGAAIALAELERPGTFSRAYLFEPILYPLVSDHGGKRRELSNGARRRTETFESLDAAYLRYSSRPPLMNFDSRSLRSYVDHGFRLVPDGVMLKCRGETEASVFEHFQNDAFDRLGEIATSVLVAAGGDMSGPAGIAERAAGQFANATFDMDKDLTHFGPMEHPDLIAARIASHLLDCPRMSTQP